MKTHLLAGTRVLFACCLAFSLWAAPDVSVNLGTAQRAPIPESIDVLHVAPSERGVWFLGLDRSSDAWEPAAFVWSPAGVTEVALPELGREVAPSNLAIAANRNGDALLLADGRLWRSDGASFSPLGTDEIARIAAADGFWLLTRKNELLYLENIGGAASKLAKIDGAVTAWSVGASGELWYATEGGQVWSAAPNATPGKLKLEVGATVTAILADATQQIWLGVADGRVARHVAGSTDWFESGFTSPAELVQDAFGNILIKPAQADATTAWLTMQPRNMRSNLKAEFQRLLLKGAAGLHDIAQDHLGGTWVATSNGAFRLQGIGELNWPLGDAQANLAASVVNAAATKAGKEKPRNHATTLGSFTALPGARLVFLNTSKGLPTDSTSCAVSDGANMWFGTGFSKPTPEDPTLPGQGVIRWDHKQFTHFTTGLPSQTVQGCAADPATGAVWFGTGNGVSRYQNGAFTNFLAGQTVLDLIVRNGEVWAGTTTSGVFRLNAATGAQVAQYATDSKAVTSLVFDTGGTLFIGTSGGLYRFTGAAFAQDSGATILPSDYVMDIDVDGSNNLWVAVWNKSVFRRTAAAVVTQHLIGPVFNGLRRVYSVRKDNLGDMWFAHGAFGGFPPGVALTVLPSSQVTAGSPAFQSFSQANGLPSNTVNYLAPDGEAMWMTTLGGVWRVGGPFTKAGFPFAMSDIPQWTSPLLVDLDNDRDLEIVAGDNAGKIYAVRPDGTSLWTYDTRNALPVPAGAQRGNISIHSSPAAGDVDGDGELDIVVGLGGLQAAPSYGGALILSRTGQFKRLLNTFDTIGPNVTLTSDGLPEHVFATPALANLDSDPELEITFGAFDNFLYAYNGDGTPIYQRDDDGDGRYDEDFLGDTTPYTPFVTSDDAPGIKGVDDDANGQIDEGFAGDDDEDGLVDEDYWEWPQNARDTVYASSFVADLDADGQKEVIFGTDYSGGVNQEFNRGGVLRVFTPQGRNKPNFPRGNIEQVIWSSPVAVDLDNDGKYEIVHGSGTEMGTVGDTIQDQLIGRLVYAWRSNGQAFKSCAGASQAGCFATVESRSFASFAVGDMDNDGSPELIIATAVLRNKQGQYINSAGAVVPASQAVGQQIYVFRADGSLFPNFPVKPAPMRPEVDLNGSPILADVDGDGFLDIVQGVWLGMMAFNRFGSIIPGMGFWENLQEDNIGNEVNGTAAVADIDLDGTNELVWLTPVVGGGAVQVVRLAGANNATYQRSWPQWRRTVNRNAVFGPQISISQAWETAGQMILRAQAFAGRNPIATVTVNQSAVSGPAAQAMTASPNSYYEAAGVAVGALPAGRYHFPVTVTDTAGRSDTQTVIFVKRGATRQLMPSATTLAFGAVRQGETGMTALGLVNTGNEAITVSSVTSNNPEFVVGSPTFPQIVQPGQALNVNVRFRPGAAAGGRNSVLTVASTDATTPTRQIALTGSTTSGAPAGCTVTLAKTTVSPTATGGVAFEGEKGSIRITTSTQGCQWVASSDQSWLQVFPIFGSGSADLLYTVFPNTSLRPRSAKVWVNGAVLTVNQNQAGNNENERFIGAQYFGNFGRYPSTAELQGHVQNLGDRADKAASFFTSDEFKLFGRFISGIYFGLLRRYPEYSGWRFQLNAMVSEQRSGLQQDLTRNFLQSQEFLSQNPSQTNEQFIRFLYANIIGRAPSQPEVDFHVGTMGDGNINIRAQKATEFMLLPEYDLRTGPDLIANLMYFVFLQRDPTQEEFNALRARIPQGASKAQLMPIIREFLESSEYRAILI